jgi:hypothetical protein
MVSTHMQFWITTVGFVGVSGAIESSILLTPRWLNTSVGRNMWYSSRPSPARYSTMASDSRRRRRTALATPALTELVDGGRYEDAVAKALSGRRSGPDES